MERKLLDRDAKRGEPPARARGPGVNRLGDQLRKGGREPGDGAPRASLQARMDEWLRADENVESLDEVRLEALPGRVGHLNAGEIGRALPQAFDNIDRYGVAAHLRELVEVEGRGSAGLGGPLEMLEQSVRVELEVRGRDYRDGIRARCSGVLSESHRVGGGLGPAVNRDRELPAAGFEEEVADAPPLLEPEQNPLTGRPHGENAVEPAGGQEIDERAETVLVERRPAFAEGGRSRCQRALDHPATLCSRAMSALRSERDGPVVRVTMARPERRNAFDAALIADLATAFADVGDARAVVLSGEGPSFSAGADVEWQRSSIDLSYEENVEDALRLYRMLEAIDGCPAPVIAPVQGFALGGGSGLVACADVVLAAKDAVFGFSEVRLGIIPAVISPFVLAKIGPAAARRYFLTGERFDAETALRIGLVHEIADDLDAAVERVVTDLLAGGPEAVRAAKRLVHERPQGEEAVRIAARRRTSPEGQDGLRAFLERRTPPWRSASSS